MLKGFTRKFKPLEILAEEEVEAIHRATLDVLETTGVRIEHDRALKLFADRGCKVDFGEKRVRIPSYLVEDCLRTCPSSFAVKARDPKYDLRIGGNNLYIGSSMGMRIVDLDTWEPRMPTMKEQNEGVRVLDALDTVHLIESYTPYMNIEGVPPCMTMPESLASRIRNSTKAIKSGFFNDSEIFAIKMAKAAGIELIGMMNPSPPLTLYKDCCEAAFRYVEAGFPISITSGGMYGATAPATTAGSTITNNVEVMTGLVLVQLIKPGTGVIISDFSYPMDMQFGQPAFGSMQSALHSVMFSQLCRRYGIPTRDCTMPYTSGKKIDFQCAYEKAMVALLAALSGTNLMEWHGAVHAELTWSPVQAVLDNDIAGWIGHFLEGVEVTDETLAIDLIEQVGPIPGHYLNKEHTRNWWKREQFIPKVADREPYPEWIKKGKKDALALAKERVEEILATHKPEPLTPEQDKAIDEILEEAKNFYRERGLM